MLNLGRGNAVLARFLAAMVFISSLSLRPVLAEEVILYTPQSVVKFELFKELAEKPLGIDVGIVTGNSAAMLRRIEAESAAPVADFFWSSSANTMAPFKDYFEPYASPELAFIHDDFRLENDFISPTHINVVAMMVNEYEMGDMPLPEKWADLASPLYKDKVIIADPASSSTAYTILYGLSQMLDAETFRSVVANLVVSASSSTVPRSVAMGEYPIGLLFEFSGYEYVAGGQEGITLIYPKEGTFIVPEYAGLVKGSKMLGKGQQAIDLLLSKEIQIAFLEQTHQRPSRADIVVSQYANLPELADIAIFRTDEAQAAGMRESFLVEWVQLLRDLDKS